MNVRLPTRFVLDNDCCPYRKQNMRIAEPDPETQVLNGVSLSLLATRRPSSRRFFSNVRCCCLRRGGDNGNATLGNGTAAAAADGEGSDDEFFRYEFGRVTVSNSIES